ncbi:MAG: hypothetical protein NVS3B19_01080 [Ginsengibacter sp.]
MSGLKKDIENRADIKKLMQAFYGVLLNDASISYIFTDVAKMNMESHLPIIVDFWEMVLFQKGGYQKNVMAIHQRLNEQSPFTREHFQIWLRYFNQTVDELFDGDNARNAKQRALSVATMMQIKMDIAQS